MLGYIDPLFTIAETQLQTHIRHILLGGGRKNKQKPEKYQNIRPYLY
jgi:hypothetical protein